jgi:protein TonB
MFEQSVLQHQHTKPWTFGVSLTIQAAVAGSIVLLSILHVQKLDMGVVRLPPILPPTPRLEDAVKIVGVIHEGGVGIARAAAHPFMMPTQIPHGIAKIVDVGGAAPEIATGGVVGSPDGVFYGNTLGAIQTSQIAMPKPPAPVMKNTVEPKKEPMRVSQGVMEARLIHRVIPVYPPLARTARIEGKVHLVGIIGKDGTIQDLKVMDGHPLLVKAAVEAVKQWIYRPTLLSGEPVDVITPIEINFTLAR